MALKDKLPPIHRIRRQRVMLDSDLARLYGVTTAQLNQAIKRNADRFPPDFRFQLSREEYANLISQFVISSSKGVDKQLDAPMSSQFAMSSNYGGLRKMPWAFTEHGALMAATVLKSSRAVQMSLLKSLPDGRPLLSPSTSFRGHALRHGHLRAAALRVLVRADEVRQH